MSLSIGYISGNGITGSRDMSGFLLSRGTDSYLVYAFDTRCCGGYSCDLFYQGAHSLVGIKNKGRYMLVRCWTVCDGTHIGTTGTWEEGRLEKAEKSRADRCQVDVQRSTGFKSLEA